MTFKKGNIVIWTGDNPCIGKIKSKCNHYSDSWNLGQCQKLEYSHDTCSELYLYHANEMDIKRFKSQNRQSKPILIGELK